MRKLANIVEAIKADFVSNVTLQNAYGLDVHKTFDEQFSKASIEAIWVHIVASAIYLHERIVAAVSDKLTAQIASEYPFSVSWYHGKALSFQLGDSLEFDEKTYKFDYPVSDTSKQIVKFVAIRQRQVNDVTILQVFATKANKKALSAEELAAFAAYMRKIGAAGTHFQFISLAPDNLEISATVYYDPQVLKPSGEALSGGEKTAETAINTYLDGIKYGGAFNRTRLTDAIQAANGVTDIVLEDIRINGDLNNAREFESASGFYRVETINITYTPA